MVYKRMDIANNQSEGTVTLLHKGRVQSVDLVRGLVMIIMALDHVRAYFHFDSLLFSPTDLQKTTPAIFATRIITHLCAPTFIFLAGTSAYFISQRKTLRETSVFLITRGLWLVFLQVTLIQFGWNFDPLLHFRSSNIISTIGICMILLSLVIHLPYKVILAGGILVVAGHNLLDNISFEAGSWKDVIWSLLHQRKFYELEGDYSFLFLYPIIPWIGVMMLGYCLGRLYDGTYAIKKKKEMLLALGIMSLIVFFVLRGGLNSYGDPTPWTYQPDPGRTVLSFFNVEKYPPSLDFLCLTLGISLVLLGTLEGADLEHWKPVTVFGKVALFYYVAHIYMIHLLAVATVSLMGYPWQTMVFIGRHTQPHPLVKGHFGFDLPTTYAIWLGVVLLLYPLCTKWNSFKARNKGKWWLSYV